MKTVLELKNVTKNIRGRTIIDDLSFTIREGEVFGFWDQMELENDNHPDDSGVNEAVER